MEAITHYNKNLRDGPGILAVTTMESVLSNSYVAIVRISSFICLEILSPCKHKILYFDSKKALSSQTSYGFLYFGPIFSRHPAPLTQACPAAHHRQRGPGAEQGGARHSGDRPHHR